MSGPDVYDAARGRWKSILMSEGLVDSKALSGRQGPCPMCGGKDRFCFDDKNGDGSYICHTCGNGLGVKLVAGLKGISYSDACQWVFDRAPLSQFEVPRAPRNYDRSKREMAALWASGGPLDGHDVVSRYLRSRSINVTSLWPSLRVLEASVYSEAGEPKSEFPVMLANFRSPDNLSGTVHKTYLMADGSGKAPVAKPRKLMPGPIPRGGAVRFGEAEEVMGVAEGIETALSAAQLFDIPVWAALSANGVLKFEPPVKCKRLIIFGDQDASFAGQMAAYSLAHSLKIKTKIVVEVYLPCRVYNHGRDNDWGNNDWNSVLISKWRLLEVDIKK
jgi:putative DNA primase/helicase